MKKGKCVSKAPIEEYFGQIRKGDSEISMNDDGEIKNKQDPAKTRQVYRTLSRY